MATFVLVHGAWHGAWCWERLIPELDELGHRSVAVELPADEGAATFETYAGVVAAAIDADTDEEPVVVGHSLAGLTIPLVAARRPLRHLVFLCALIAMPGRSFLQQATDEPGMVKPDYLRGIGEPDEQGRTRWVDFDVARDVFYPDCEPADARAAFERLRPQARAGYSEACALDELPDVPTTYVCCGEDGMVNPAWSHAAVKRRLGVDPVPLAGGHSPFLSRPAELARLLHGIAG